MPLSFLLYSFSLRCTLHILKIRQNCGSVRLRSIYANGHETAFFSRCNRPLEMADYESSHLSPTRHGTSWRNECHSCSLDCPQRGIVSRCRVSGERVESQRAHMEKRNVQRWQCLEGKCRVEEMLQILSVTWFGGTGMERKEKRADLVLNVVWFWLILIILISVLNCNKTCLY